jgi:hypothetical protein
MQTAKDSACVNRFFVLRVNVYLEGFGDDG